jgi:ribosomal protein L11 methylase PrmA
VLHAEGRVFRTVEQPAWDDVDAVMASGILGRLISTGRLIGTWPIDIADAPAGLTSGLSRQPRRLFEHERIPFTSYPYEWPFSLLKRAALHHLDLHIDLLASGLTLSDASAFNVQFRGTQPVFIDFLSMRRYREGEYWAGYRQFCQQFLDPLLLGSLHGIPHQAWFRGDMEGIPVEHMARLLPLRARLSPRALLHVLLHAGMMARERKAAGTARVQRQLRPMPKGGLVWMLEGLRKWVAGLKPRGLDATVWRDYEQCTPYSPAELEAKRGFVARYVERCKPVELFDLGCNNGSYSQLALEAGATRVIGFDSDAGALEAAVARADAGRLNLLPLFLDATNPSPDQGWGQRERLGFQARAKAEGLLALAFLHHLVIGRNVPLPRAIEWLVALAPSGVVEFVPKQDPTIQRMLSQRADIFPDYHCEAFRGELTGRARVVNESEVGNGGRMLFEYRR